MLFLRNEYIKVFIAVMVCLALLALGSIPGELWMPFAEFFPDWLTKEPLTYQVARLGPFFIVSAIIAGGVLILRKWY